MYLKFQIKSNTITVNHRNILLQGTYNNTTTITIIQINLGNGMFVVSH